MADARYELGRVPKNRSDYVAVAIDEYDGHVFVDVRIFSGFVQGEAPKATKKGVTLHPAKLPALLDLLGKARDEAVRRGLIAEAA